MWCSSEPGRCAPRAMDRSAARRRGLAVRPLHRPFTLIRAGVGPGRAKLTTMRHAPTRRQVLRGASAASLVAGGLLAPQSTAYADARAAGVLRDPDSLARPH